MSKKEEKLKLAKSANEIADKAKDLPKADGEPEIPWEQVQKEIIPAPDLIVFRVPEKTETGIVLPDGRPISADSSEYRPVAEIVGKEVTFIEPGDAMVLHEQAEKQAMPLVYKGHKMFLVHQQFAMAKTPD